MFIWFVAGTLEAATISYTGGVKCSVALQVPQQKDYQASVLIFARCHKKISTNHLLIK